MLQNYFRLGRIFFKGISKPQLFKVLCQFGMSSHTVMAFALQVLANLGEERGGKAADRGFRMLVKLVEKELEELKDPEIPAQASMLIDATEASVEDSASSRSNLFALFLRLPSLSACRPSSMVSQKSPCLKLTGSG